MSAAAQSTKPWQKEGKNTDGSQASNSGKTVVVGCKLPNGLHMDLMTPSGRERQTLRGANSATVVGGWGITQNVPADFFHEWMKQNAGLGIVKNGLIFEQSKVASAKAEAKEKKDVVNGLERLNPEKPGKGLKPMTKTDPTAVDPEELTDEEEAA